VVARAYGLNIQPELITGLGTQTLTVVQSLFGLAGADMAIYGRVRATQPLKL